MLTMRDFATGNFTAESLAIVNTFATVAQALFSAMARRWILWQELLTTRSATVTSCRRCSGSIRTCTRLFIRGRSGSSISYAPETAALSRLFSGVLTQIVDGSGLRWRC